MALPSWAIDYPWPEIHECAGEFGIDPALVAAIIQAESGGMSFRLRAEPHFEYLVTPARFAERLGISKETEVACQKISWGLMQVMGGTARDMGFTDLLPQLIVPEVGVYWGCKYLGGRIKKYKSVKGAVAAYNAGSLRINDNGQITNQKYVDKVMGYYEELK